MEGSAERPPLVAIGVTLAGIALIAGLVATVPELHRAFDAAIHGDSREVRAQVEGLGVGGALLIVALTLIHAVVFYPAEIIDAAAGFVYGFCRRLPLMSVGWLLSGLLCYAVGRSVARPLLDRWLGARRFERAEATVERGGATILIAVRLIPIVPFSLICYAMGAARVPLWRFTWTTVVGYLPVYRPRRLLRHPAGGTEPHRSAGLGQRRGAAGPADLIGIGSPAASGLLRRPAEAPDLEAKDRRGGIDVAGRIEGLDPHHVDPYAEAAG